MKKTKINPKQTDMKMKWEAPKLIVLSKDEFRAKLESASFLTGFTDSSFSDKEDEK